MTRIISGAAGSLVLAVPPAGTRPTSDRVRESLFGALGAAGLLDDMRVVDLYAGSGALGLEALSRGAASVDLVERNPRAAGIAERNARAVGKAVGGAPVRVHRSAVDTFLAQSSGPWDLAFVDPPYELGEAELGTTLRMLAARLTPGATVVVERARRSPAPALPAELALEREKRYGDTTLWWAVTTA